MSEAPRWTQLNGEPVPEDLLTALSDLRDALTPFQESLEAALDVVEDVEQVINLLQSNDPIAAVIGTVASILDDYIDDLLKTGVYFLPILPGPAFTEFFRPFPTSAALQMVSESLTDRLDSERPQGSQFAGYGALAVLGGTNTFFDFIGLIETFRKLFGDQSKWAQLGDIFTSVEFAELKPERGHRQSEGTGWNWTSFRLEEIRVVEDALLTAKAFIRSLAITATGIISDTLELIVRRIKYYITVARKVIAFLEFLRSLSDFIANVVMLPMGSLAGGTAKLQSDLLNSRDQPQFQYALGFMLVGMFPAGADDGDFLPFKKICTLFGANLTAWDGVFEN